MLNAARREAAVPHVRCIIPVIFRDAVLGGFLAHDSAFGNELYAYPGIISHQQLSINLVLR